MLYANLLLNILYHIEIEMKIRESCLQTGNFIYKPGISLTKQDFHLQRGSLGLQRGFSGYYLPGETALSEKTMLNPSRVVTYAISEKDYDKSLLTDELIDPDKQVSLELWAYNPKQFSEDNSADDISLVLSFTDTNDERIEEAVDELQERRLHE